MASIIRNQNADEFHSIKYGLFPMSFNGCEIIAVYNALILMGRECDLDKVKSVFVKKRLRLIFGLFGSNVYRIHRVLEALHIANHKVKLDDTMSDGIYVISFWNRRPPWHGIHTVTTVVSGGIPTTYNLYRDAGELQIGPKTYAGKRYIRGYRLEV